MLISIIIPVIRPEKAKRCIEAIRKNAGIQEYIGSGKVEDFDGHDGIYSYEIIAEEDKKRIGVTKMVKMLTDKSKGQMVCFLGDDTIPQPDFLKNAIRAMRHIPDGWGMVSFNDNPNTTRSAAHWLCHKKLLPKLGGEFFHTGYQHCFCDDELMIRCQTMNRYIYAFDAIIHHDHPMVHKDLPSDQDYRQVYSPEVYDKDHKLFLNRMNNNWKTQTEIPRTNKPVKVAIGIPSGDMIHADFSMSLINLCLHSLARGIQCAIINPRFSLVEIARNELVQDAFNVGADYLLTLDSDMTFPAETLVRLLSHKKAVVCTDAKRRREPFTSVLTGMDGKPLDFSKPIPANDPLVEVRGGSNAVCLVKMDTFKKMKAPYYLVTYNEKSDKFLGEDYFFSNKLRQAGFRIYCDSYLSQYIGHNGTKAFYLNSGYIKNEMVAKTST